MNYFILFFSLLLFYSLIIHRGESLKCYTCTAGRSTLDPCVKDVTFGIAVDCAGRGKPSCMVEVTDDTIARTCGNHHDCKDGSACTYCYEDYCNNDYTYKCKDDPKYLCIRSGPILKPPK